MKKKIAILGSTGSIGKTTFNIIKKNKKKFNVVILTTNKNAKEVFKQAKTLNVKNVIIQNRNNYLKLEKKFKKNNIKVHFNLKILKKIIKQKIDYTMCSITVLAGMKPTMDAIEFSKTVGIANKESIICAWPLIKKKLKKFRTKFIQQFNW